jgi:hypothetical protein
MPRRGFFGLLLAPLVARFLPTPEVDWTTIPSTIVLDPPVVGTYGAIDRATFSFWRNQQAYGSGPAYESDRMRRAMSQYKSALHRGIRDAYVKCK